MPRELLVLRGEWVRRRSAIYLGHLHLHKFHTCTQGPPSHTKSIPAGRSDGSTLHQHQPSAQTPTGHWLGTCSNSRHLNCEWGQSEPQVLPRSSIHPALLRPTLPYRTCPALLLCFPCLSVIYTSLLPSLPPPHSPAPLLHLPCCVLPADPHLVLTLRSTPCCCAAPAHTTLPRSPLCITSALLPCTWC